MQAFKVHQKFYIFTMLHQVYLMKNWKRKIYNRIETVVLGKAGIADRSSTGLVEFENKPEAVEALILANHISVDNPGGKNPFCFKLCFSASPIINN
ncbi:hypothetical protein KUTeg_002618 [Tegillarca granosa]|uniref:Heterogeneous nuclear ribonucleoprotein L RRM domain-containing protein n=1 Tax=Tegillarca granosa TaxID=220873 RepID=A0ABQ9FWC0_TEGGR|nr:hypothetical protein KUTeg_002618 [Tegillarca granosa]